MRGVFDETVVGRVSRRAFGHRVARIERSRWIDDDDTGADAGTTRRRRIEL